MGKYKKSLYISLLNMSAAPLLILGVVIAVFSSVRIADTIYGEVENSFRCIKASILTMYDEFFPGDFLLTDKESFTVEKGGHTVNEDLQMIDSLKEELGVDITFFFGDTRVITTIHNQDGERIIGTKASEDVIRDVLEGNQEHFYSQILISEKHYFAYYSPVYNDNGDCVGMLFIAKPFREISKSVLHMVFPIVIITLLFMAVMGVISIWYSRGMVSGISKIDRFLYKVSRGDLTSSMDTAILARKDEMGEMARHIVTMQRSFRELVEQDMLTGLANRRCGENRLRQVQEDYIEKGIPFSLVIGDIDFFKRVNDTYGHACGDKVLKKIAEIFRESMWERGCAIRWGGEEFLLIYENMEIEQALPALQNLAEKVRRTVIHYEAEEVKVTMTFGIVKGSGERADDLLRRADDRLYYGKMNGRDRIVKDETAE